MSKNYSSEEVLQIGREYPQPGEEQIAHDIVKLLQDQMVRLYEKGKTKQLRQIHPKMNGCIKSEFIIKPNLPPELRVGLFKEATSFPAWIRFSNGDTKPLPDYKKDIRGFAIKIMNVPGEKLDDGGGGAGNHDFILMNTKSFVSSDVKEFASILKVVTTPFKWSTLIQKIITVFSSIPLLGRAAKAKIHIKHPAEIPYFSTVPYSFGDETKAVKYAVFPSPSNTLEIEETKSENFLRKNLAATLLKHEIVYDFKVQFQTNAAKMPIEDPTVEWTSEFIKVATIKIPTQVFDTPEQNEFGDNLSFSSWHCLEEHRPIGNFNRVRKIIYRNMYEFRHQQNNIPLAEPTAGPDFFTNTNI
ncbi:MAG: catalase family protein [Sphingobacteriales bacterium]